jgi:hypothetical protein
VASAGRGEDIPSLLAASRHPQSGVASSEAAVHLLNKEGYHCFSYSDVQLGSFNRLQLHIIMHTVFSSLIKNLVPYFSFTKYTSDHRE